MTSILAFENLSYHYAGQANSALENINLRIPAGSRVAILGRNGSGKSTLFLHCNGILKPTSGTVYFKDQKIKYDRKSLRTLRRQVGVVFQHPDDQLFSASVAQDISFGPLNLGVSDTEARQRVAEAAALCDMTDLLERPTHALSGGEKARAALAGVLAMQPEVLLIDEPTASLDPWMRRKIFSIFARLHQQGTSIILATHEIEIARYWADFVVIMDAGQVLAADEKERVFENHELLERMGLMTPWYMALQEG